VIVVGIDPGNTGAIGVLQGRELMAVYDMPVVDKLVSERLLVDLLRQIGIDHLKPTTMCVIEQVAAMPGQGVSSMFKFGTAYGIQRCAPVALGWPTHLVTPAKWKRDMGLSSDKELSRRRAIQQWPSMAQSFARKKDDGRAEAALLALWWLERHHELATPNTDQGATP
jgi:crossover junction endodeoxyribonuclease RuvC